MAAVESALTARDAAKRNEERFSTKTITAFFGILVAAGITVLGVMMNGHFNSSNDRLLALETTVDANRSELQATIDAHRSELQATIDAHRSELQATIDAHRSELQATIDTNRSELEAKVDALVLRIGALEVRVVELIGRLQERDPIGDLAATSAPEGAGTAIPDGSDPPPYTITSRRPGTHDLNHSGPADRDQLKMGPAVVGQRRGDACSVRLPRGRAAPEWQHEAHHGRLQQPAPVGGIRR